MTIVDPATLRNQYLDKLKPLDGLAEIFPWMTADDFNKLVEDIAANGQHQPILTHEGRVVDGKHRELAAVMAGKQPVYQQWNGEGSLISRIASDNLYRRHLNESQRAMVAAKLWPSLAEEIMKEKTEKSRKFARNVKKQAKGHAAKAMNVSERSVDDAITVLDKGTPGQKAGVAAGELAVSAVANEIRQDNKLDPEAAIPESAMPELALAIDIRADQLMSAERLEAQFQSWKEKLKQITETINTFSRESDKLSSDLAARIAQNCCKAWSDEIKQDTIILYDQMIDVLKGERSLLSSRQYKLKKSIEHAEADRKNVEDHHTPLLSFLNITSSPENSVEQKGAEHESPPQPAA